jgi:hypothetical protein
VTQRLTPLGIVFAAIAMVAICGSALAYFSTNGTGTASAAVGTLTTPKISAATAETGGRVKLTWSAATVPGGTVTYFVERDGGPAGGSCPSEAAPTTVLTCTDTELAIGAHEFTVTAVYRTWSRTSPVATATVAVGVATQFSVAASTTTPAAGAAVNLTITALDEKGSKVTTFTGSHNLVFSGTAPVSPRGTDFATVSNSSGTALKYGETTAISFTSGVSTVSTTKNGVLKLYKVGEATVTASEGSITDATPVEFEVGPAAAAKFTMTAARTSVVAGEEDPLTITAFDTYGNLATGYTGAHKLVFSPASTVGGNVSSVTDSTGTVVAIGTATSIEFSEGVAEGTEGRNGVATLYKSGAQALKATEGSITNATAATVTVTPGPAASMTMTGSPATVAAGGSETLTLTALDAYGNTATSYTGTKNLVFSGAAASPLANQPTVTNASSVATNFGQTTTVAFASGVKAVSAKLYKMGAASVSATDGTFTTNAVPLTVTYGTASRTSWVNVTQSAGTGASTCFTTCVITGLGNGGTVTGSLEVIDAYGNVVSNYGAAKTATLTASVGTVSGSPMTIPETGPAVTSTAFTFAYPATGTTTATLTATITGRTAITGTAAK